MTRNQQIAGLRKLVSRQTATWFFRVGMVIALFCAVQGVRGAGHGGYMGAFFVSVIAFAVREAMPHLQRAADAIDTTHSGNRGDYG